MFYMNRLMCELLCVSEHKRNKRWTYFYLYSTKFWNV